MKIITLLKGETPEYSAQELKKYIISMSRGSIVPEIEFAHSPEDISDDETIVLGLLNQLSLDESDLDDPFIEDILDIDVINLKGYIAGSNERSILMGVYKYCTSAGCRFIRPGEGGDYVPKADLTNHAYKYRKKADHPFRGECSEGCTSYEHMRDTVYWLPKIGMNMYMIEGLVPYAYMHKWYGHISNTKLRQKGQITDYNMLQDYINILQRDVQKTGIQLHTLGHAWMFEKLGIRCDAEPIQQAQTAKLTDEQKKHFALVNGKRDLYCGNTFYTHFCYSNPETRKLLVDFMVEYAQERPHVDFVHFWLADNINNQCECENCIKMHPSDWYVMMLNELDERLTQLGLNTRVVFIMYIDTVRPPEKIRLNNPGRFVLLSAIGDHYEKGYINEEYTGDEPAYIRNQYTFESNALRLKWHRDWKRICNNIPSIIYEYRYYVDMYCDISQMQICRETHRDMKTIEDVAFQGCMSDQTPRMFMPTALPLIMMGETLFDKTVDYDDVADTYFEGAFGEDGKLCREYLEKLSDLLSPSNFRHGGNLGAEELGVGNNETDQKPWINNAEVAEKAKHIPVLVDEFMSIVNKNIALSCDEARRKSWYYLTFHGEICKIFSKILVAGAENNMEMAREIFEELKDYLSKHEMEFHNVFDLFLFLRAVALKVDVPLDPYYD